jgi:hypothetical protein
MAWYLVKHRDNFTFYLTPTYVSKCSLTMRSGNSVLFVPLHAKSPPVLTNLMICSLDAYFHTFHSAVHLLVSPSVGETVDTLTAETTTMKHLLLCYSKAYSRLRCLVFC